MVAKKQNFHRDYQQNEIQNAVDQNLASAPSTPAEGQFYWNTTTKKDMIYNGTEWVDRTNQGKAYDFGDGLNETNLVVTLNNATASTLGGVIIGSNISVSSGTISVADASTSAKGVIEIATDAEATTGTSETLAVNPKQLATKVDKLSTAVSAGTYTKVTTNAEGLVTYGTTLTASDIPDISATYITADKIGVANGVAGLDGEGKVPSAQLPSYVDDVIELLTLASSAPATCATGDKYYNTASAKIFTATATNTWGTTGEDPEKGVIYVDLSTNKTYRWSGSTMIEVASAPGQATESTAGIAALATQAECTTGTNDTKIVTPFKLATYTSSMARIMTANNPALTTSSGQCTWTISNTLQTADCGVFVKNTTTNEYEDCYYEVTSSNVTIKINSANDITAGKYKAIIIG